MKDLNLFISNFLGRAGSYVFSFSIISKALSFFASWIAIKLISNKDLGSVIYAFQIVAFIIPIAGLGLNQGLIRYGSQLNSIINKNKLFIYCLKYGVLVSFLLIFGILITATFINFKLEKTHYYLIILSFAITSNYIFGLIKVQFLLHKNNKLFSFMDLTYNILLVFLVFVLSYFFYELGYAIALVITPLITSFLFIKKLNIKWKKSTTINITNFAFWKYGFFASLSNVTTLLLVSIDIILIGSILNDLELVTAYKYISLIPFSFLFASQAVITTDFVTFTEKIHDKKYVFNYIKSYMKLFSFISVGIVIFIYFFGAYILTLFEENYSAYNNTLIVLTIGITGILIFRGIFGNLLSSLGKAHINFIITLIALLLNLILNYYFIPKYGILGAAITSAFLAWFTSIAACICFFQQYKKINV